MSLKEDISRLRRWSAHADRYMSVELTGEECCAVDRVADVLEPLMELTPEQLDHLIATFEQKNAKAQENIEAKQGRLPAGAAEASWEAIKARRILIQVLKQVVG